MKIYQHTQNARYILVSIGSLGVVIAIIGAVKFPPLLITLPILILVAWLFRSLTIEINDAKLRWSFGPGLFRKHVTLKKISSAKPVRTNVLEGWGIHYSRFGWLCNVSGFDAVAITLKNGKRFCLGTDEAEILAAKLVESGDSNTNGKRA